MTRKEMLKTLALTPLAGLVRPGSADIKRSAIDMSAAGRNAMELFPLGSIKILAGPFKKAQETDHAYLLSLEADRLLYWHRKSAGLEPKADHYGGWENGGSNILGHYLSACAHMYCTTGDKKLRNQVDYIVDELDKCQQRIGTGALFNDPGMRENFKKMRKGVLKFTQLDPAFPLVNGQNPWYGIHKICAGLRDAYQLCKNDKAKNVLISCADWASDFSNQLTEQQFQAMLDVEHGGMAEVVADVYAITQKEKYYNLAKKFVHQRIAQPLAEGRDILYPEHANAQVPKFVGYARMFEVDQARSEMEGQSAFNFWDIVLRDHTLAIGGNGEFERFGEAGKVSHRIGYSSAETCNTYNMLKLSKHLFTLSADHKYIDYYERALYNHILASIGPEEGMFCYYVSHKQGYFKTYSTSHDSNWCCVGTGMENPSKYGQIIYSHKDDNLYINLFIESSLSWEEKDFTLVQKTNFPEDKVVRFRIEKPGNKDITLKIRQPYWVDQENYEIKLNGKRYVFHQAENGYIEISRNWSAGDEIELDLPMQFHFKATPDIENIATILYGPLVMAGDFGHTQMDNIRQRVSDQWVNKEKANELKNIPVLVGNLESPDTWIKPDDSSSSPLVFSLKGKQNTDSITLKPFYKIEKERYAIYWDLFSHEAWHHYEEEKANHISDTIYIGDRAEEEAHNLKGQNMYAGESHFNSYRGAEKDGWFSYNMATKFTEPLFLRCTLWGGGYGSSPAGVIEIFIDDKKITTIDLKDRRTRVDWVDTNHPMEFYEIVEAIPQQFTEDKKAIVVKFQARTDMKDSGIYACRLSTAEGLKHQELLNKRSI